MFEHSSYLKLKKKELKKHCRDSYCTSCNYSIPRIAQVKTRAALDMC